MERWRSYSETKNPVLCLSTALSYGGWGGRRAFAESSIFPWQGARAPSAAAITGFCGEELPEEHFSKLWQAFLSPPLTRTEPQHVFPSWSGDKVKHRQFSGLSSHPTAQFRAPKSQALPTLFKPLHHCRTHRHASTKVIAAQSTVIKSEHFK